jgi:2-polyprenyl-3-methyl-5-hydroxy-6-metoxy-1,4-benzoquinol methylase
VDQSRPYGPDLYTYELKMRQDRIKWNEKYRKQYHPTDVTGVVKRFYHLAPGKKALDIAAGNGRNAVFLSRNGFSVDAVDISEVGLAAQASTRTSMPFVPTWISSKSLPITTTLS